MVEVTLVPQGRTDDVGSVFLLTAAGRARLVMSGEVDASLNAKFADLAREAERLRLPVDVDMRNVTFMDSSAIAMLARLAYQQVPHRMQIIQPPDVVLFLLEVTAVGELVDTVHEGPVFDVEGVATGTTDWGVS